MAPSVLVVDDAEDIRELLCQLLEMEGYRVMQARHGREALDCVARHTPALILLDLNMPVMNGWQFHAELQAQRLAIPVVLMTAGRVARAETLALGAAGYLAKPFDIADVLETVARCAA